MQCSAHHQAVRHHTESIDGAARHAGCSGPMRPCATARRRRQGSVGQVRECTGPAMQQHTYTQCAHNTHSPPVYLYPWVDIPAFCHLVIAPSAHHTTPHHTTPHHTFTNHSHVTPPPHATHHTSPHHATPHHTTPTMTPHPTPHYTTPPHCTPLDTTQHNTLQSLQSRIQHQ